MGKLFLDENDWKKKFRLSTDEMVEFRHAKPSAR